MSDRKNRRTFDDGTRICGSCKGRKLLEDFPLDATRPRGRTYECKSCLAARNRVRDGTFRYSLQEIAYRHQITVIELIALYESHNKQCDICHQDKNLDLDLGHTAGKIRGLLCRQCNTALGSFRDDPNILRSAIAYLENANGGLGSTSQPHDV